jgi:hypothetical protein
MCSLASAPLDEHRDRRNQRPVGVSDQRCVVGVARHEQLGGRRGASLSLHDRRREVRTATDPGLESLHDENRTGHSRKRAECVGGDDGRSLGFHGHADGPLPITAIRQGRQREARPAVRESFGLVGERAPAGAPRRQVGVEPGDGLAEATRQRRGLRGSVLLEGAVADHPLQQDETCDATSS